MLFGQESDGQEEANFKTEALQTLDQLTKALEQWETQQLLGGQYDKLGAVLSIQVSLNSQSVHFLMHVRDGCQTWQHDSILLMLHSMKPHQIIAVQPKT